MGIPKSAALLIISYIHGPGHIGHKSILKQYRDHFQTEGISKIVLEFTRQMYKAKQCEDMGHPPAENSLGQDNDLFSQQETWMQNLVSTIQQTQGEVAVTFSPLSTDPTHPFIPGDEVLGPWIHASRLKKGPTKIKTPEVPMTLKNKEDVKPETLMAPSIEQGSEKTSTPPTV